MKQVITKYCCDVCGKEVEKVIYKEVNKNDC